ncbi:phosphate ABC transporter substrate-binding protein PstS [Silanimonas sp.]|jgi:phosphate transport system substrate-binding protein|uniref:phosphate ABC transporter substrate-binding protein PstS n=1 Tax=Silanimonas sp. TaxID=1929290 RepID=UPI0037C95E34
MTSTLLRTTLALGAASLLAACGGASDAPAANGEAGAAPAQPAAIDVTGAGASFVFPLLSKWSSEYATGTGNRVNYQSIGSGGGIAQAKAGTVDFGSTDAPLKPEELAAANLGQFPSVVGGVVPVVNIEGLPANQLRLTGPLLADIYLGKIAQWNDPAIVEINPGVTLPESDIKVVYRSDGSGTTFNFVNYLGQVSPAWVEGVGQAATAVKWPTGVGGKGNEGVAAYTKQLSGAIGYVELSYALQNNLTTVSLQNAAGNWVAPSIASFQAAAASADWANAQDFHLVITNAPGAEAWPIAATNFILVSKAPSNPAKARAALEFFKWGYANGDARAEELGYVPLPDALVTQVEGYWAQNFTF